MKLYNQSLLKKTLHGTIIVSCIIIFAFFLSYKKVRTYTENRILDTITTVAEVYEGQVYHFLENAKNRTEDFASDGYIRLQLNKPREKFRPNVLSNYLIRNKLNLEKMISAIHILSMDGKVIASTNKDEIGMDFSREPLFTDGKNATTFIEKCFGHCELTDMAVASPILNINSDTVTGVIITFIRIAELNKFLSGEYTKEQRMISHKKTLWKTLEVYLVNKDRFMLTQSIFPGYDVSNPVVNTVPIVKGFLHHEGFSGIYKDYRDKDVIGASRYIPLMNWILLVEIDKDEGFEIINLLLKTLLITAGVVIVTIILFAASFIKSAVQPINRISHALEAIAGGNYDMTLPVQSSDEIGKLCRSFNSMAHQIRVRTDALIKSEASLSNAQRISRMGNWDWDIVNNNLHWSDEIYRIFGLKPQEFGATYEAFLNSVHPDDREFVKESVNNAIHKNTPYCIDHRIVLPDSTERIVHEKGKVIFDNNGNAVQMNGTVQDITKYKKTEEELKKLSVSIEQSINVIFITDIKGNIEYVNPMFEKLTGYRKDEVIGQNPRILASGETTRAEYEELWKTITDGKTWRGVLKNKKKNGQYYWGSGLISPITNEKGQITHFLAVQEDITEKMKSEERIRYLAIFDELTGLYNRAYFVRLLNNWLSCAQNYNKNGAVLLINVDKFRLINDAYGHSVGDRLLRSIAELLQNALRDTDHLSAKKETRESFIGRMGGDEFAIFLPFRGEKEGIKTSEYIRKKVERFRPVEITGYLTISIGIVLYPEHGITTKELFTKADAAIYSAKEQGQNMSRFYRPEDRELKKIHSRALWKGKIQDAVDEDRFVIWFQPIRDLRDNTIHHYETLVRMYTHDGKIVFPVLFIDAAETLGLISVIDRIVIDKTMKFLSNLNKRGLFPTFSINLSGKELSDEGLLEHLKLKLSEMQVDPKHLVFEITETSAIRESDKAMEFIKNLRAIGCGISLDDFGVGFTSFKYLQELEIDYIKIDGSFIKDLHKNHNDRLFVKAIADVAKGMKIKTVAEFVEHEETLKILQEYGVDYAQGYFIGKPSPEVV